MAFAILIFLGGAFTALPGARSFGSAESKRTELGAQCPEAVRCGPNALYMFLKAHGAPVAGERFFRTISGGAQGLSLLELRDISARYGLPAEVRRCTYEQMSGSSLPLIALLHVDPNTKGSALGHYVVVTDIDGEGVGTLDGTSGEWSRFGRDAFCRYWNGYVVVRMDSQPGWLMVVAICAAVWILTAWLIGRSRQVVRSSHLD